MFAKGRYVKKASGLRDMVVQKTLANFLKLKTPLYEQGADHRRIGRYVMNWWRWGGDKCDNLVTVDHRARKY